jgi:hypothetical protein
MAEIFVGILFFYVPSGILSLAWLLLRDRPNIKRRLVIAWAALVALLAGISVVQWHANDGYKATLIGYIITGPSTLYLTGPWLIFVARRSLSPVLVFSILFVLPLLSFVIVESIAIGVGIVANP